MTVSDPIEGEGNDGGDDGDDGRHSVSSILCGDSHFGSSIDEVGDFIDFEDVFARYGLPMPHIRHELNDHMDDVHTFHRIGTAGAIANIGTGHQRSLDTDDENSNDSDIRALAEIQRAVFGPRDIPNPDQSTSTSHTNNIIDLSDAYQQQPLPPDHLLMAQPTIAAGNDNGNDLQSEGSEHPTFAYLLGSDSTTTSPESLSRDEYHEMRAMPPVIFPRRPGPRRLHYFRESDILDIYFRKAMLLAKLAADTMESIYASGCLWMDPTLMYGIGIALEVETKIMVLQAEIDELDESIHKMELIRMTESSKFHIRTKLHEFQDKITRKAERDRENNDDGDSSDGHTEASDDDDPSNNSK